MIKSVVVERSTHDERRATHQRLAELFADQPERRGHHLAEAADAPDEEIAAAIEEAAHRTLERGDVVGAISRLLRAADLSPNRTDRSRRLADTAYTGARLAGDLDRASALLRDAHRRDPTLGETLHAAVATAYLLLNSDGNADTAAHLLLAAIDAALGEPDQDRDGLSDGLYTLVLVCHYAGRPEYWVSFHDAMSRLPRGAAPAVRLLADTFADPLTAPARALSELDHEIRQLRNTDDAAVIMRCSIAGFYTDRLMACREALWRVVRDGREGGAVRPAMTALAMIAFGELSAGRWDEAQQLAAESTALCEERGYRLMAWTGRYATALIAGNRGDRQACQEICQAMIEWATPRQLGHLHEFAHHAARPGRARRRRLRGGLRPCDGHQPSRHAWLPHHSGAVGRAGRDRRCGAHRTQPARRALTPTPCDERTSGASRPGSLSSQQQRRRWSPPTTKHRICSFRHLRFRGSRSGRSSSHECDSWHGERLRRLRRTRDARSQLEAARDGFERLGARPWSRRAATELAATGATRQRVTGGGAVSLTLQEREIALLAATGLTNRQIATRLYLSPRTVSAHLYRIFPKLGITSRAALRDALNATSSDTAG